MSKRNGHNGYHAVKQSDDLIPVNIDAEESTIGALLIDPDAILRVEDFLRPDDFYLEKHRMVYEIVLKMYSNRQPVDPLTLQTELEKAGYLDTVGGPAFVTDLIASTPTSIHVAHYARIVQRHATQRRLIDAATKIAQLAYDQTSGELTDICAQASAFLSTAINSNIVSDRFNHSMADAVRIFYDDLERLQAGKAKGIMTGIKDYDRLTNGYQPATMNVLAARPRMGKTTLALQVAIKAAKEGKRVLFFSLDSSANQIIRRMVSHVSQQNAKHVSNNAPGVDWNAVTKAAQELEHLPIQIIDLPAFQLTPNTLRSMALKADVENRVGLIVIDYLQLMRDPAYRASSDSRNQEITSISGSIKALARELDVPILALSQLSRSVEKRGDKRPMDSDLRDSGTIEQDADTITFLYRDEVYNPDTEFLNLAEIILSKQKDGPEGTLSVFFQKATFTFCDLEIRKEPFNYG